MTADDLNQLRVASEAIYRELADASVRAKTRLSRGSAVYAVAALPGYYYLSDADQSACRNALTPASAAIAKLAPSGSVTARLLSGEKDWEWWKTAATECRGFLDSALATMGAASNYWGRFWDEVVLKSATDLQTKILGPGIDLIPWVAAGAVALAVIYVVFAFRAASR